MLGSSPLTRGKLVDPLIALAVRGLIPAHAGKTRLTAGLSQRDRLIPAHAGKTRPGDRAVRQPRAHPRSRGENSAQQIAARNGDGSSPLTRGKQIGLPPCKLLVGLIPAHAGKTVIGWVAPNSRRAHPRSRGENHRTGGQEASRVGSSPLTRGKRCE